MAESIFCQIYELNVTNQIGKEYIPLVEDLMRMIIIQVIYQMMFVFRNPNSYGFFDGDFIEALFYLTIGVCVYWLVFKRLVLLK
tara:strand:+ start:240 stop:491 length:252 start_codon:yes stop_codon:yes gene_type:complete